MKAFSFQVLLELGTRCVRVGKLDHDKFKVGG